MEIISWWSIRFKCEILASLSIAGVVYLLYEVYNFWVSQVVMLIGTGNHCLDIISLDAFKMVIFFAIFYVCHFISFLLQKINDLFHISHVSQFCFLFYKLIIWTIDFHYLIIFNDDLNCSLTRFNQLSFCFLATLLSFISCKRVAAVFKIYFCFGVLYKRWHRYFFLYLFSFTQVFKTLLSQIIIIIPYIFRVIIWLIFRDQI